MQPQSLQLTPDQAVEYISKHIEKDFDYYKLNLSSFETTNLPPEVISNVTNLWEAKGYKVLDEVKCPNSGKTLAVIKRDMG